VELCTRDRVNVFVHVVMLHGLSKLSLAGNQQCRLQLCTVFLATIDLAYVRLIVTSVEIKWRPRVLTSFFTVSGLVELAELLEWYATLEGQQRLRCRKVGKLPKPDL
jgi:hypothetical protein